MDGGWVKGGTAGKQASRNMAQQENNYIFCKKTFLSSDFYGFPFYSLFSKYMIGGCDMRDIVIPIQVTKGFQCL
jgi:hypothetical protein